MARKPDLRYEKALSWVYRGRATGFPVVLSFLLLLFGFVFYLSAARGSSSSSSNGHWSSTARPLLLPNQEAGTSVPAPAAAAAATALPCLTLLQQLMPLTNFSSLRTAELLDAAINAQLGSFGTRQLMQLQQGLFCQSKGSVETMSNTTAVQFKAATLHLYADNDLVSQSIANSSTWEATEVENVLWALQQPIPQQQQQQGQQPQAPLFVDIGANVGVFSVNAAAAGARVAAFEAMPSNVALIRQSLCSTPWLAEKVALYGTGLGSKSSNCFIISDTINRGDGHTVCDKEPQAALQEAREHNKHTYEVRGEMTVRRLDTLLAEDVQVMKIDVEGFELEVLQGAQRLLQKHNVWYIMAECNIDIIGRDGEQRYFRFLDTMGYYISTHSFAGPFLPVDRIRSGRASVAGPEIANLYCVKKTLLGPNGSMIRTKGSLAHVMMRPEVAAAAAAARGAMGGHG